MHAGFQKYLWENGVGDDWLKRNKSTLGSRDLIGNVLNKITGYTPKSVLEIGCSNGWRLKKLKEKYGCSIAGIDPSLEAVNDAAESGIHVDLGTADSLPYKDQQFDMVIFGFCLCFISPEDWFNVVRESDRVLKNGGLLLIYDFIGTKFFKRRMMQITLNNALEEKPLYLYNFNWPTLWLAHPSYTEAVYLCDNNKAEFCVALHKDLDSLLNDNIEVA